MPNTVSPRISIIVPVYKIERYLRQCVDSILVQTYTNLEVILVNDGSPDNCGKIIDEYSLKDRRIIAIHKENGGISDARNAGIEVATGQYLGFIDSDDWIEPDMIELLYNNLIAQNADISLCSFTFSYVNFERPLCDKRQLFILDSDQAIIQCLAGNAFTVASWGKLYKREIFSSIRYPIDKQYEDAFIIVDVMTEARVIVGDSIPKYHYRMRGSSTTNNNSSSMDFSRLMNIVEAHENICQSVETKTPHTKNFCKSMLLKAIFFVLQIMLRSNDRKRLSEYPRLLSAIRDNYRFIIESSDFTRNEKIRLTALKINIYLFKLLQLVIDKTRAHLKTKDEIFFD